jgi:hypothetical protein
VRASTGGSIHEGNVRNAFGHQIGAARREPVQGPYLGAKLPGSRPVVFAPGVLSDAGHRLHGFPAFSPDLKEVFWPVLPPRILTMRETGGVWNGPTALAFPPGNPQAAFVSSDGRRLYFQAVLPGGHGGVDIWFVEREGNGWGPPQNLGAPVNTPQLESQPSLTTDGTLYFTGYLEGVWMERGIYRAARSGAGYSSPELLPPCINSPFLDYTPFVDPAERLLLFASSRPDRDEGSMRLYVAFRTAEGTWSEPVNLSAALGFEEAARFPSLSPDGKFLFFLAGDHVYWTDAGVLRTLQGEPAGRRR